MTSLMTNFQTYLQADWIERIGWTLVHSLWEIAVITGGYAIASRLLRNRSASSRYITGCVAMSAMFALPIVSYLLLMPHTEPVANMTAARNLTVSSPSPQFAEPFAGEGDLAELAAIALESPAVPLTTTAANDIATDRTRLSAEQPTFLASLSSLLRPWVSRFTAAWFLGVVLFSLRPIWGWLHVRRLKRQGLSSLADPIRSICGDLVLKLGIYRTVQFAQSARVVVPTVVGSLRPLVLLPVSAVTGLSLSEIELIVAHELAHVRRHDYLFNLVQTIIEAILFYHPGMWWVSNQIRRERENCCDDLAVQHCGNRVAYARTLAWLEENRAAVPTTAVAAAGGSLLERVQRIVGPPCQTGKVHHSWLATVVILLGVGTMVPMALAMKSTDPTEKPAAAEVLADWDEIAQGPAAVVVAEPEPQPDTKTPESDRDAMLAYARALAAGDWDALAQIWIFQDNFDREFAQKFAEMCAQARDMRVELITIRRLGENSLFACFLAYNGPDQFGQDPSPMLLNFQRKEGRWQCSPPGNLRLMLNARNMSAEQIGRRAVSQSMINMRFNHVDTSYWIASFQASAEAFERLAGPPYNLSQFETIAEQMSAKAADQEAALRAVRSRKDLWQLALQEHGKEMLPQADDFYICFYLEAEQDDSNAREFPFVHSPETFRAEPFPCLTDDVILEAKVVTDKNRQEPVIDVQLTKGGVKLFEQMTRDSIGKRLAFVMDGKVIAAPKIRSAIPSGHARIDGSFTQQEAETIAEKLNSYRKKAREFLDNLGKDMQGMREPDKEPAAPTSKAASKTRPQK